MVSLAIREEILQQRKKFLILLLLQQIELPTELQSVVGYTLKRFW